MSTDDTMGAATGLADVLDDFADRTAGPAAGADPAVPLAIGERTVRLPAEAARWLTELVRGELDTPAQQDAAADEPPSAPEDVLGAQHPAHWLG